MGWSVLMITGLLFSVTNPAMVLSQDSIQAITLKIPPRKPEVFSSGFIDISTAGQVNASARLIRIHLGEPGKFSIPISIYSGVSSGNFAPQGQALTYPGNDALLTSFINPLSGLINLSLDGNWSTGKGKAVTSLGIAYQGGGRILTGYREPGPAPPFAKPLNFFNGYAVAGLYFQTGAWEKNDSGNIGVFWLAARYICSLSSKAVVSVLLTDSPGGFYHGWSVGGGVDITRLVNFKVIYYRYVRGPDMSIFPSLCQFSFYYSLKD